MSLTLSAELSCLMRANTCSSGSVGGLVAANPTAVKLPTSMSAINASANFMAVFLSLVADGRAGGPILQPLSVPPIGFGAGQRAARVDGSGLGEFSHRQLGDLRAGTRQAAE